MSESKRKSTKVKKPARRKSSSPSPVAFKSSNRGIIDGPPISTRDHVYACIKRAAPGADFDDGSVLSSIPVRGDDVGRCLNQRIPLIGDRAWKAGEIDESWNVSILIRNTDYKRNQ